MSNRGKSTKRTPKNTHHSQPSNDNDTNNNPSSSTQPPQQRNRRRKRHSSSSSTTPTNQTMNNPSTAHMLHGSAMPIPSSRRNRARRTGVQSKQIQSSLSDSTWNRTKRHRPDDLKFGAPYNEWHSFYSNCSCDEILQELTLALKSQPDLDINIHSSGYKIRGRKFMDNIMCEFQIEMFYTTSRHPTYPNHILVEFQRRNGDGFVFQSFLHSIFKELHKTKIVTFTKFPMLNHCHLTPTPLLQHGGGPNDDNNHSEEKKQQQNGNGNGNDNDWQSVAKQIDPQTLKMLISALFAGDSQMCRSASSYLANNIANNVGLVCDIIKLEPHIITKFSDLLLKCVDPQIVRSIGCTLYHMLQQSDALKNEALKLNVKTVCKKVYKRWTEPVETRYGSNNKYVIRVIPSMQVAQRMSACIEVLE